MADTAVVAELRRRVADLESGKTAGRSHSNYYSGCFRGRVIGLWCIVLCDIVASCILIGRECMMSTIGVPYPLFQSVMNFAGMWSCFACKRQDTRVPSTSWLGCRLAGTAANQDYDFAQPSLGLPEWALLGILEI